MSYSHTEKACPIAHTGTIQPIAQSGTIQPIAQSGTKLHRQLIGSKSIVIRQDSVSGVKFSAFSCQSALCQSAVMHQPGDEFDLNELVPPLPFPDEPRNFHEPQVDNSLATHNPQGYQSFYAGGSFSGQYPSYTTYYQAPGAPYPTGSLLSPTHSVVPNYQNTSNSGMTVYNGSPNYHGSPGGPLPLAYLPSYNGSPARPQPQLNLGSPQPPLAHPAIPSSHRPPGTGTTPAVCPQSLQVTAKGASRKSLNSSGPSSSLVSPLPVILDYLVYTKSKAFMLAEAKSTSPITVTSHKDWVKMEPESVITWDIVLGDLPWAEVQEQVIQKLDQSRPLLGSHIRSLARSELISWQCILINDTVYGVNRKALVSTAQGFTEFCAAVRQHPTWQSKLKIIMPHPAARAKQVQVVQEGNDNLTMSYGAEDDRLKLGLLQARLDLNPKADTSASLLGPLIERITAHIMEKYGSTTESMRIKDPAKPTWSFRIHGGCLWAWARALHHKAPNVDIDNPPKDPGMFISEPEQVYTRAEKVIRDTTSGQAVKHGGKGKGRRRNPTSGSDSESAPRPKFTPSGLSKSGRVLPPRLAPSSGESAARSARSAGRGAIKSPLPAAEEDELASSSSESVEIRAHQSARPMARAPSTTSTDIEFVPRAGASDSTDRSPAKKIARSPCVGIAHTISRLQFNQRRRPAASVPPQRKRGASQASSALESHSQSVVPSRESDSAKQEAPEDEPHCLRGSARDLPPLNAAGRALTIEQFLDHCNFAKEDHIPQGLIQITQVHHWDFFYCEASVADLLYLGYPFPVATQLLRGAQWLATTHVELPNDDTPDEV
ncbi:hypothetical protein PSTG_10185 [Puccinia striiformis f. sp. tritici PST-78]|uniref:Uncharacterized protein n=1 Tax=Puccinia striiformis f. sp. tritici PST-78 TaxID=1165861 RepID=A0A0L0VBZ7_9BASI|nr:hypothetical protein PSTG_10185 [Puccinia striiformis f. sp. tritici PST-78]